MKWHRELLNNRIQFLKISAIVQLVLYTLAGIGVMIVGLTNAASLSDRLTRGTAIDSLLADIVVVSLLITALLILKGLTVYVKLRSDAALLQVYINIEENTATAARALDNIASRGAGNN